MPELSGGLVALQFLVIVSWESILGKGLTRGEDVNFQPTPKMHKKI